jgi:hypothetical protein
VNRRGDADLAALRLRLGIQNPARQLSLTPHPPGGSRASEVGLVEYMHKRPSSSTTNCDRPRKKAALLSRHWRLESGSVCSVLVRNGVSPT